MNKDERLLTLVTTLLSKKEPVPFSEIRDWFDDYRDCSLEAAQRKFERDKADLKELGVPLRLKEGGDDQEAGYYIDPGEYYLKDPDLAPRERALLYLTARAALELPEFPLKKELRFALSKLACKEPMDLEPAVPAFMLALPPGRPNLDAKLTEMTRAMLNNKTIRMTYNSLSGSESTKRIVEPYGLFMKQGNWYMVGFCRLRDSMRVFKVDRIESVEANRRAPSTPDFEVPEHFDITDYSNRPPYCFDEHEKTKVVVRLAEHRMDILRLFHDTSASAGDCEVVLDVTDSGALLDMLLPLRDAAVIKTPEVLRQRMITRLEELMSHHSRRPEVPASKERGETKAQALRQQSPDHPGCRSTRTRNALDRVRRILSVLPKGLGPDGAEIEREAKTLGVEPEVLVQDLQAAMMAGRFPFSPDDLIEVAVDGDRYRVYLDQRLGRPLRLTPEEALGLTAAAGLFKGLDNGLDRALKKVQSTLDAGTRRLAGSLGRRLSLSQAEHGGEILSKVNEAMKTSRRLDLVYRTGATGEITRRSFAPYTLINVSGDWYTVGHCRLRQGIRVLKVDRIVECTLSDEMFDVPEEFDPNFHRMTLVAGNYNGIEARFRLKGKTARLFKEARTGAVFQEERGGDIIVSVQGGGLDWLSAWTLSKAEEAEILEPEELRDRVLGDLTRTLEAYR